MLLVEERGDVEVRVGERLHSWLRFLLGRCGLPFVSQIDDWRLARVCWAVTASTLHGSWPPHSLRLRPADHRWLDSFDWLSSSIGLVPGRSRNLWSLLLHCAQVSLAALVWESEPSWCTPGWGTDALCALNWVLLFKLEARRGRWFRQTYFLSFGRRVSWFRLLLSLFLVDSLWSRSRLDCAELWLNFISELCLFERESIIASFIIADV